MTERTKDLAKLLLTPIQFEAFLNEFDSIFKKRNSKTTDLYTPILGKAPSASCTDKNDSFIYETGCRFIDMLINCEEKNLGEA